MKLFHLDWYIYLSSECSSITEAYLLTAAYADRDSSSSVYTKSCVDCKILYLKKKRDMSHSFRKENESYAIYLYIYWLKIPVYTYIHSVRAVCAYI